MGLIDLDANERDAAGNRPGTHPFGGTDVRIIRVPVITTHHDERLGGQGGRPLEASAQDTRVTGSGKRGSGNEENGGGEGDSHRAPPNVRYANKVPGATPSEADAPRAIDASFLVAGKARLR